jgi:hypothetical protein
VESVICTCAAWSARLIVVEPPLVANGNDHTLALGDIEA